MGNVADQRQYWIFMWFLHRQSCPGPCIGCVSSCYVSQINVMANKSKPESHTLIQKYGLLNYYINVIKIDLNFDQ